MFVDKLSKLLLRLRGSRQPEYITVPISLVNRSAETPALPPMRVPNHVAIIMDGNGRWAKRHEVPRAAGHAAGVEALREIIRASDDWGVKHLTIYAFSTENWARSNEEVEALMALLLKYFASEIDELDEKNVRILIIGDVDQLPDAQREAVINAMERTKDNTGLRLNIALSYGGRAELVRAARTLAKRVEDGALEADAIDEAAFESALYTAGQPDVDLLIRTSGEQRLSNFLPWQTSYAELVFDRTLWPDFDRAAYKRALNDFANRDRRYGRRDKETEESHA